MKLECDCWDCRQKAMKKCKYHRSWGSVVEMAGDFHICKLKPKYNAHKDITGHHDCTFDSKGRRVCKQWEQKSSGVMLLEFSFSVIKWGILAGLAIGFSLLVMLMMTGTPP